ncbi:MAG: hypothetical protein ACXVIV_07395 [Halobacteriota archaeon]
MDKGEKQGKHPTVRWVCSQPRQFSNEIRRLILERPLCVARPHEVVPVCLPTVAIAICARDQGVFKSVCGGAVFAVFRLQRGGVNPDGPECRDDGFNKDYIVTHERRKLQDRFYSYSVAKRLLIGVST